MSAADDEAAAIESFHRVLHDVPGAGMHGEGEIGHDCGGGSGWIDDYGWDRIPVALLAAGWTAPSAPGPSPDTPDDPEGAEEVARARDRARQAAEVHGGAGWTRMSDPGARTEP